MGVPTAIRRLQSFEILEKMAVARLAPGGEYGQISKEVGCESEEGKAHDPHQGKDKK